MRFEIILFINGQKHQIGDEQVFWPLSRYIRESVGLTGTKVVCAEGDCGACTVLVSNREGSGFFSINSCISPVFANDGKDIITIEGLSLMQDGPHAVSEAMMKGNGAQCGFCSPGFVLSLTDLYEHNRSVDEQMVRDFTTGNLCRCTGYLDIIKSALSVNLSNYKSVKEFFLTPEHRQSLASLAKDSLCIHVGDSLIAMPTTITEYFTYKEKYPQAKIISAATDLGVLMNKGKLTNKQFIFIGKIAEFNTLDCKEESIYIGASKTLKEVQEGIKAFYPQFSELLNEFASPQIKNRATLIGNIANGSPIGDSLPFLITVDAVIVVANAQGTRDILLEKFYKGYKDFDLKEGEIITGVHIPKLKGGEILKLYKVANRTHLDIATVSAAFKISLSDTNEILALRITYGGVAATVLRLQEIEKKYCGRTFNLENCQALGDDIAKSITPLSDVRGSADFRKKVAANLAVKLFYDVRGE